MPREMTTRESRNFYEDVAHKRRPMRSHMDTSTYYMKHWKREWRLIAEDIGANGHFLILDVGCGPALLLRELDRSHGHEYLGMDIAKNALPTAKNEGKAGFMLGNAEAFPIADGVIDVVVASHLIEHLHNAHLFLSECHRVLKPHGRLIVATPNDDSPLKRPLLLKSAFAAGTALAFCTSLANPRGFYTKVLDFANARRDGMQAVHTHSQEEHVHEFGPEELRHELESIGFKMKKIRFSGIHVFRYSLVLDDSFGSAWFAVSSRLENAQSRNLAAWAYDMTFITEKD